MEAEESPDPLADEVFTPDTPEDKQMVFPSLAGKKYPPVFSETELSKDDHSDLEGSYVGSSLGGGGESGSSELTEDNSLEWIKGIRLFEYRLSSTDEDVLQEGDRIHYSDLIQQLQVNKLHTIQCLFLGRVPCFISMSLIWTYMYMCNYDSI